MNAKYIFDLNIWICSHWFLVIIILYILSVDTEEAEEVRPEGC